MGDKYKNSPHVVINNTNTFAPQTGGVYGGGWGSDGSGLIWTILIICAVCFVAVNWKAIGLFGVATGIAWVLIRAYLRRRDRVRRLSERASAEDDLFLKGDPRGVYGTYTGAQDFSEATTGPWDNYEDGLDWDDRRTH